MSDIQVWTALYLSIGISSVLSQDVDSGAKAAAIVLWPIAIIEHWMGL